jgi:Spy/CpxP family protein refolding chaperone
MKKLFLVLLVVLCVMGLVVNAGAAEKKKGSGPMSSQDGCCSLCGGEGQHSHMEMFKHLGLDEKQASAVKAIHSKTRKEMIKRKADIQIAEIELKEILSSDTVDMAAAEAAVKKVEGMKSDMKMMHIKAMSEIKSNLNPEQKKKFSEMMGSGSMMGKAQCDMHGKGKGKMGGMHHDHQ